VVATPEPVAAPVTTAPVANEVVSSDESSTVSQKMNEFGAKLQQLNSIFAAVKGDFKTLEKVISRELKSAQKSSTKRAKRAGNRQPSGFVKPTKISAELAAFLGKSNGTEMARTAVSKEINNYIRTHQLQDKANGRKINPDAKLSALLNIKPEEELTYFNLQRFMKHHFIKAEVVATA
jgi:chromatin remodeling complex protein RSC6